MLTSGFHYHHSLHPPLYVCALRSFFLFFIFSWVVTKQRGDCHPSIAQHDQRLCRSGAFAKEILDKKNKQAGNKKEMVCTPVCAFARL